VAKEDGSGDAARVPRQCGDGKGHEFDDKLGYLECQVSGKKLAPGLNLHSDGIWGENERIPRSLLTFVQV
jgi:hypothetical protein